ncbi:MAG: serine/threonine-protein phosphatase [Planctomycetota bacterium]|nr:MAG: serine/threonine-protein phosphatase [Planctomycetota bacterium]REK39442.1 MAG: serine/threonine-protein phosphatase [Planctomycetota bacterium]
MGSQESSSMQSQSTQCGWKLRYAALSDVGMRRQNNQDAMNVIVAADEDYWEQRGHLFMVCDGMGAHAAGELASKMAADGIPHTYNKDEMAEPAVALRKAILDANRQIYQKGRADPEFQGMGTTCSAMVLLPEGAMIGHVGDSRVYRWRGQRLEQLTFDHSLAWEVRAASEAGDQQLDLNLPKNIITRSLGPSPQVKVDLEGPLPVEEGDKYLLCSDGLTGPLSDVVVGNVMACLPPEEAVRALVDMANLRGGPDNITVVVVEVGERVEQPVEDPAQARRLKSRLLWVLAVLAVLVAIVTWVMKNPVPSMLAAVGAIVAAVLAIVVKFGRDEEHEEVPPRPLGQAPYASFDGSPQSETAELLAEVLGQLRQVADDAPGILDEEVGERLRARLENAPDAAVSGDAIREDALLVSAVVAEFRKAKSVRRSRSDSAFDVL